MAIEIRSIPEEDLIIATHVGKVPDHEFLSFYKAMFAVGSSFRSANLVVDLRATDSSPRSSGILQQLAEFFRNTSVAIKAPAKVAVISPRDLGYGLARMYGALADAVPWEFLVFRSADEAARWLGVSSGLLDTHRDHDSAEAKTATQPTSDSDTC